MTGMNRPKMNLSPHEFPSSIRGNVPHRTHQAQGHEKNLGKHALTERTVPRVLLNKRLKSGVWEVLPWRLGSGEG